MKNNKLNNNRKDGKQFSKKDNRKINEKEKKNFDDQVEGRNSVLELLESEKDGHEQDIADLNY